ncbi:alpha/beta hydrolase [Pseudoduganella aquatica]|uniref:Alpha/beta fold hydrolase n=1 Tax=Pseudoduganella aquatica TaxID=2660641 RepID=A0A7X4HG10_9BURK|nr:alpha/beta fold hydrolase [Pseudoduganella aquatica]MYN10516.1 alpha/beta fold hydrolase [Pseudoduganella aquatica]
MLAGAALGLASVCTAAEYTALPRAATLSTPSGDVQGTLMVPLPLGCAPVALIIAGSGPTDRDGNSKLAPGANNSLKMLAQALAEAGIASVRYDKRGIGASARAAASEAQLRFETYSGDAAAWVHQLRQEGRYSSVTVIGHSEGSLIGMLAARAAKADGFISLSGPAERASLLLRRQLDSKLPAELAQANDRILSALESGKRPATLPTELQAIYRPSVQPYMISWFKYVPSQEFAKLRMPALIVQGTTDIQVGAEQATLLHKANPASRLVLADGVNHVLKRVPADMGQQMASYSNPALPLAPAVAGAAIDFIHGLPQRACR